MARTPEGEVMAFIRDFFKYDKGIFLRRQNVGAIKKRSGGFVRFGEPGDPDWFGIIDRTFCPVCGIQTGKGVPFFIEAKSARGRLSPEQKEFLGRMNRRFFAITLVAQPKPGKDDPTGFRHLRRQLERIREQTCDTCQKEKDAKENGKD